MAERVAAEGDISNEGLVCAYCGADGPEPGETCEATGTDHMLVSKADKTTFGQGAGSGPQGGGTMIDLEHDDLGYGGSVGLSDTDTKGLRTPKRSALGAIGSKRRFLAMDPGGASSGAMTSEEIGPALGPPGDDKPPSFVPADPASFGISAPPPVPETIRFCPFCSSGNVVGRSDGAVSCGYCGSAFAVVQRNQFPFMPGPEPGVEEDDGDDGDDEEDQDETDEDDLDDDEDLDAEGADEEDQEDWDGEDPNGLGGSNGDDDGSEVAGSDTVIPADVRHHGSLGRRYRTPDGLLREDLYLRRLAFRHTVNRDETLLELRDA